MSAERSIYERAFFTVAVNFVRSAISFVTGVLVARWMGPENYGDMAFLIGTFVGLRHLIDMGSSSAFFTFASQEPRSRRFAYSYFVWLIIQFILPLAVIGFMMTDDWLHLVWQGNSKDLVLIAFVAVFLQHILWPTFVALGESQRLTIRVQSLGLGVVSFNAIAVWVLWTQGLLNLHTILLVVIVEYFVGSIICHSGFRYEVPKDANLDSTDVTLKRYINYCKPIVPYAWLSFAYIFADRWLLQSFGGKLEQAYYAIGAQFAAVALIATTAILRLFWKEIAESHHQGDVERTRRLYLKVTRSLFLVSALISGFVIPWATVIVDTALGPAYQDGVVALTIMFLYPVHQSLGQVGGAMLMATEKVSIQVRLGIGFMACSMVVTYFVLAPDSALIPGLGLAATGLALKMVILQFLQVNLLAYIIARIWKWKFDWFYQFVSLPICLAAGFATHWIVVSALGVDSLLVSAFLGPVIFVTVVMPFVFFMPWLLGMSRQEVIEYKNVALKKVGIFPT